MSEIKHTPGQWKTEYVGDGEYELIGPDYTILCGGGGTEVTAEMQANAQLIAAAPDLLVAMQELFKQCAMVHKYGGTSYNQTEATAAISAAVAAITKATKED